MSQHDEISARAVRAIAITVVLAFAPFWASAAGAQGAAGAQAGSSKPPVVTVSILPQAEFVARIAGDKVKVLTLVGPGASPHNYEPTPRQMADLSASSLWFTVGGVEFEKAFLPKVKALYPRMRIVNTAENVQFRTLETHRHEIAPASGSASGAGAPDTDEEGGPDPHVWLGHEAVKAQLASIADALCALLPADAPAFRKNLAAYVAEIDATFSALAKELAPLKGKTVYVYHPSFGYFFDAFGIKQEAVEVGGKEPTQKTLALLIQNARADGAKVIFVQKQFSPAAAKTVAAAIGGVVVEIDPLAPDWLANIRVMGDALKAAALKAAAKTQTGAAGR